MKKTKRKKATERIKIRLKMKEKNKTKIHCKKKEKRSEKMERNQLICILHYTLNDFNSLTVRHNL